MPAEINVKTFLFADDGEIPNNPSLPLVLYPGAFASTGRGDPAKTIEAAFKKNGWGDSWRDGIFPYVHYHAMIHEALGVARGRATVRFGGAKGEVIDLQAGDAAVLPAGTGHHCLWFSPDFLVVGAYPKTGTYNLFRGSQAERDFALKTIPQVPLPQADPIFGKDGPLLQHWRAQG